MVEVIWFGRGGHGCFTAARLLGSIKALVEVFTSKEIQDFINGKYRRAVLPIE
jgi:Pyruvate/2-oxoacid:ferredoxin oxidoreductase gamma subunit